MIFLYSICAFIVIASLLVIISRNPIHSIFALILVFLNVSLLFITIEMDFFSMILIMVYVGAVAVLFLFVIMMLDIRISELSFVSFKYIPMGFFLVCLISIELYSSSRIPADHVGFSDWHFDWLVNTWSTEFVALAGAFLYTNYYYVVVMSSALLLLSMVGAIFLTLDTRRSSHVTTKRQDIALQIVSDFRYNTTYYY